MNALLDIVRDALTLTVTLGLPLLAVAVLTGLLAGWLGQLTGVQDPSVNTAIRAAAIIGALWWAGGAITERVTDLTHTTWQTLPALGRAGVPTPPSSELDAPPVAPTNAPPPT